MTDINVKEFYDKYAERQKRIGVNERILSLYKRLLKIGLKSDSNVLELGCGIGVLTSLIWRKVNNGQIECVDLSPKSINIARKNLKGKNIHFYAENVVTHVAQLKEIDFIILFDVLEHIPVNSHGELFKNISNSMNSNTKLLINIPSPENIEYDRKYRTELLQIIDQPLYPDYMTSIIKKFGLRLKFYESSSIWNRCDYDFYHIEKIKEYEIIGINIPFMKKVYKKLSRLIFHNRL